MEGGKYSVEKREKIEEMYFIQKMSLTNIAEKLNVSVSYVSRLLRQNEKYHNEQEIRKQENQLKRKKQQKELIYSQRKEKARQRLLENQAMKKSHEQATKEMSKGRTLGNETLRRWCSLYNYNKDKKCYEFNTNEALKPRDFPLYIKV